MTTVRPWRPAILFWRRRRPLRMLRTARHLWKPTFLIKVAVHVTMSRAIATAVERNSSVSAPSLMAQRVLHRTSRHSTARVITVTRRERVVRERSDVAPASSRQATAGHAAARLALRWGARYLPDITRRHIRRQAILGAPPSATASGPAPAVEITSAIAPSRSTKTVALWGRRRFTRTAQQPAESARASRHQPTARAAEIVWRESAGGERSPSAGLSSAIERSTGTGAAQTTMPRAGAAEIVAERAGQAASRSLWMLDAAAIDRLTDDVIRRVERHVRIERERRGL